MLDQTKSQQTSNYNFDLYWFSLTILIHTVALARWLGSNGNRKPFKRFPAQTRRAYAGLKHRREWEVS